MKVTQIFGLVLLFHLVAISLILLQPGCQNQQPPPAPDNATQTGRAPTQSDYGTETSRSDYVPPVERREPTRPAGSGRSSTTTTGSSGSSASGALDPAFNAGLTGESSSGVLQPMLEPSVDLGSSNTSASPRGGSQTYTVARGDNLTKIAREFGVSVNAIKNANGLSSSTIRVGQELTIPSPSAPTQSASVDSAGSETYSVRAGDTLSGIAKRHGVTVAALKSANSLSSDRIVVGQDLYIPASSQGRSTSSSSSASAGQARGSQQPAADGANTYTVQSGDTPSGIAKRFGIDYRELMRVNNIASASRMQVGQRLIIPGGGRQSEQSSRSTASASSGTSDQRSTTSTSTASAPTTRQSVPQSASRPATLNPQTSQPARIGGSENNNSQPASNEPVNELDLLESDDLPLMDVEVVGEE